MNFSSLPKELIGLNLVPGGIYWATVVCLWAQNCFALYLCIRQRKFYSSCEGKVPRELEDQNWDLETFEKSRRYGLDKNSYTMFSLFYYTIVWTALLHFNGLYKGWTLTQPLLGLINISPAVGRDIEIPRSIAFSLIALAFKSAVELPLSLYWTFVLEEKHGFNNQTLRLFVKNFVKHILVNAYLTCFIDGLTVTIVKIGGEFFFVWLWILSFLWFMFYATIYLMVIAPLFDKYTPLKDGDLRNRIENLAAKTKFPLTKIYVLTGSGTSHSNAYMCGLFFNKRIVLYDTMLKGYYAKDEDQTEAVSRDATEQDDSDENGCSDEEVEAVLGHELGHWKLNHISKYIAMSQANVMFEIALFALFYQNSAIYEAFGFPERSEKSIIVAIYIFLQRNLGYGTNAISRIFEFQADKFSVDLGYGKELKRALIKLSKDNLIFPCDDPMYATWYSTHPALLQRLHAIDEAMNKICTSTTSVPFPELHSKSISNFHPTKDDDDDRALKTILKAPSPGAVSGQTNPLPAEPNLVPKDVSLAVSPDEQKSGPEHNTEEQIKFPSPEKQLHSITTFLRVCKTLTLTKKQPHLSSRTTYYVGIIRFRNTSPRWPVAYRVIMLNTDPSISPDNKCNYFFPKDPPMGHVECGETKEIHMFRKVRPKNEEMFAQELYKMRIAVAAFPIYYRSQLEPIKIEKYWNLIIGTNIHPAESCELHEIQVISADNALDDPFPIMSKSCKAIGLKDSLPKSKWIPPPSPPMTQGELEITLKLLAPTESDRSKRLIHQEQVREVEDDLSVCRKSKFYKLFGTNGSIRNAYLVLFGLSLFVGFFYEFIQLSKPPPPPPPPPPKSLWKFW